MNFKYLQGCEPEEYPRTFGAQHSALRDLSGDLNSIKDVLTSARLKLCSILGAYRSDHGGIDEAGSSDGLERGGYIAPGGAVHLLVVVLHDVGVLEVVVLAGSDDVLKGVALGELLLHALVVLLLLLGDERVGVVDVEAVEDADGENVELVGGSGAGLALLLLPGVPLETVGNLDEAGLLLVVVTVLGLLAKTVELEGLRDGKVLDGVNSLPRSPVLEETSQSGGLISESLRVLDAESILELGALGLSSVEGGVLSGSECRVDLLEFRDDVAEVVASPLLEFVVELLGLINDETLEVNLIELVELILHIVHLVLQLSLLMVDEVLGLVDGGNERRLNLIHI